MRTGVVRFLRQSRPSRSLRKLFRIYSELFHPRKQCCAVEPKTRRSSFITTDASFAFGKRANDLIALLPLVFISNTRLSIESVNGFFHDSRNRFSAADCGCRR